jgi:hypothetical protein
MRENMIYDTSRAYRSGEVVEHTYMHKGGEGYLDVPQHQHGRDWVIVSYSAVLIPYDVYQKNLTFLFNERHAETIHESKLKYKKLFKERFLGWKVRMKSLKTGHYVSVMEEEIYHFSTSEVANQYRAKQRRNEKINEILS